MAPSLCPQALAHTATPCTGTWGRGLNWGVTVRRSLSLSLALLHSMFPLGEVGREASPSAWGSQAQDTRGKICGAGLGKARGRGRGIFQKIPPSSQALLSALEEFSFPGNQGLSRRGTRQTCLCPQEPGQSPASGGSGNHGYLLPRRAAPGCPAPRHQACWPCIGPAPRGHGVASGEAGGAPCSSGGETGSPSFAHSFLRPSDSCPLTPTLFQGPDAISSAYNTHLGSGWGTHRDRRLQWPRAKKAGGEWGTSREAIGGSKALASASLGVFHSIACSGPLPFQLGLIGGLGCP